MFLNMALCHWSSEERAYPAIWCRRRFIFTFGSSLLRYSTGYCWYKRSFFFSINTNSTNICFLYSESSREPCNNRPGASWTTGDYMESPRQLAYRDRVLSTISAGVQHLPGQLGCKCLVFLSDLTLKRITCLNSSQNDFLKNMTCSGNGPINSRNYKQ